MQYSLSFINYLPAACPDKKKMVCARLVPFVFSQFSLVGARWPTISSHVGGGLGDLEPDAQTELRIGGEYVNKYGGMSAQTARCILKVKFLTSVVVIPSP